MFETYKLKSKFKDAIKRDDITAMSELIHASDANMVKAALFTNKALLKYIIDQEKTAVLKELLKNDKFSPNHTVHLHPLHIKNPCLLPMASYAAFKGKLKTLQTLLNSPKIKIHEKGVKFVGGGTFPPVPRPTKTAFELAEQAKQSEALELLVATAKKQFVGPYPKGQEPQHQRKIRKFGL